MITKLTPTQKCLRRLEEVRYNDGMFTEAEQRARVSKLVRPGVHLLVTAMVRAEGIPVSLAAQQAAAHELRIMSYDHDRAVTDTANILKEDLVWPAPLMTLTPEAAQEVRSRWSDEFEQVRAVVMGCVELDEKAVAHALAA